MLYVITYDIASPVRLRKLAKCCELYGGRVEKSVFEMRLDEPRFQRFWKEAQGLIDAEDDALVAYRVCAACEKEILLAGKTVRPVFETAVFIG